MDMQSVAWLIIAVISFIFALSDAELRKELKDVKFSVCMICMMIALYYSIMYVAKEWITWCL